jgi:PhzF family phenazine biosynthesis protein
VAEDPVCGSGNGCVAAWLARHRHANKNTLAYTAEQGVEIGRHGWVHVAGTRAGDTWSIEVGGAAVSVLSGTITLP